MVKLEFNFFSFNCYLFMFFFMGLCLGIVGYFMGFVENIGEVLVIYMVICLFIGYGFFFIIFN